MAFLEGNRFLYLTTLLGEDKLLLSGFTGQEGISRLFSYQLEMLAENTTSVDFDKLIGQKATFGIDISDRSVIYRICPDHPTLKFVGDCLKVA